MKQGEPLSELVDYFVQISTANPHQSGNLNSSVSRTTHMPTLERRGILSWPVNSDLNFYASNIERHSVFIKIDEVAGTPDGNFQAYHWPM